MNIHIVNFRKRSMICVWIPLMILRRFLSKNEIILKLKEEINNFNRTLDTLKESHTSLVDECYHVLDTLVEKMEIMECVKCPILKLEIETLKVQLTHVTSLSCTCYIYSNERGNLFKKTPHITQRNKRSISSKAK